MKKAHNHSLAKIIAVSLAMVLLAGTLLMIPAEAAADTSSMGTLIDTFTKNSGSTFTLTSDSRLFIVSTATELDSTLQSTAQLAQKQFAASGYPTTGTMNIVWGDQSMALDGDILLVLDESCGLVDDGYQLEVAAKATVTAKNTRGLLYGLNTLLKHFRMGESNSIVGFTAQDEPDTIERTLHLDCARKYFSKEWICNMIREISWMGFNAIELHFSEDGGFRMDFWGADFVSPTGNDFSWVCGNEPQYWYYDQPDGVDDEKYLSTEEIIEILNVAKEYQIEVIPSFDTPGHVDYLTYKYYTTYKTNPEIANIKYGEQTYTLDNAIHYLPNATTDDAGINSNFKVLDLADEKVQKFAFAMYTDIAAFFKQYAGSTNFNICGDEIGFVSGSGVGYTEFYEYANDLYSILSGMGYKVRMYNDFVDNSKYTSTVELNENIEIVYWTSPTSSNTYIQNALHHINNGRTIYSGYNLWTYYALRTFNTPGYSSNSLFNMDARNPNNTWWTMYRNGEEYSYAQWDPSLMPSLYSGKDSYTSYTYSGDQLAGGYFMIWCDYSQLNTEQELWNGVWDSTDTSYNGKYFYDLRARMWSNIIKQWNWDIDSSVTFTSFETLRDSMGDFPGLVSGDNGCSTAASLPAATEPIRLISQAELAAAIGTKLDQGIYTDASYSAYSAAYDSASAYTSGTLTAAEQYEIPTVLSSYKAAYAALALNTFNITVNHYAKNTETPIKDSTSCTTTSTSNHYEITVSNLSNYAVETVEGSGYTLTSSGAVLSGDATSDLTITVYYKEIVDLSALEALIATGNSMSSTYYTDDSWAAYSTALSSAKAIAADPDATQDQVDAAADALRNAYAALEAKEDPKATSLTVELLSSTVPTGKQVGFRITSEASVESLTITCDGTVKAQAFCSSQVQTLDDGDIVKIWLVFIDADTAGTFTYTINGSVSVTVKIVDATA